MTAPRPLSWENFRATVLVTGQRRVHRITEVPFIEVFGDGIQNRVGLWVELPVDTELPPELFTLALITCRTFRQGGRLLLEIATEGSLLQRQFYHFAVAVAERMLSESCPPVEAVTLELRCFTALLEEKAYLGIERQIGLLGELLFLERLVTKHGIKALNAWLGPMGEPHDFRWQMQECEVKTTVSPYRTHTIHGPEQLVPSQGCSLHLVSVLLGPPGAGSGFSLTGKVEDLARLFAAVPESLGRFTHALTACGFRTADRAQYTRLYTPRRPMALVRVDETFPAITRSTIHAVLGPLAPRVEALQYDVNVDGLEQEDGTTDFEAALAFSPEEVRPE